MTDIVMPSRQSDSDGEIIAGTIREAGGTDGWIQESGTALFADDHADISGAPLNAFSESSSGSSTTVTIDTGEGFVYGAWLARDVTTNVSLAASTTGQTVYVGWDWDGSETVIIGLDAAFNAEDPKIALYDYDTDGTGVTSVTDRRQIGRGSSLGVSDLADGSTLGRWVSDALAGSPVGTAGDTQGEVFRVAGSTSDLLFLVESGQGKLDLVYNAYLDAGTWKSIVSGDAYRLSFGNGDAFLAVENTGSADATIGWSKKLRLTQDDVLVAGTKLFDIANSEVPQAQLGGPASSLSAYPLQLGDIDGSAGSAGQVLETDGNTPQWTSLTTSGEWTTLLTESDTDTGNSIDRTFTPGTTYDIYKFDVQWQSHDPNFNNLYMRVNNDAQNVYAFTSVGEGSTDKRENESRWSDILEVEGNGMTHGEIIVRGSTVSEIDETHSESWPTMTARGGHTGIDKQTLWGHMTEDHDTVTDVRIWSQADGVGKIVMKGKNL